MTEKEQETTTIEVVDKVEEMYGDKSKSKKTVTIPKEEVKADVKTEPEVKPEAKPEEKKDVKSEQKDEPKTEKAEIEVDDFNDLLDIKSEKPKPKVKLEEIKDTAEKDLKRDQEFEQYKKKADLFESLASTPIGKVLLKAQEMGKNPLDILQDISPVDYTKMSSVDFDESRAREYFSKVENLTGDELKDSVEEFMAMDEGLMKKKMRREQVSDLSNLQQHKLKDYQESLESAQSRGNEIVTKLGKDAEDFVKDIRKKGGKVFGMQLTDDQLSEFSHEIRDFSVLNDEGFVDVNKVAASIFFIKYGRQRLKENYLKAYSKGKEEVLDQVHNVDRNDQTLNNQTFVKEKPTATTEIEKRYGAG